MLLLLKYQGCDTCSILLLRVAYRRKTKHTGRKEKRRLCVRARYSFYKRVGPRRCLIRKSGQQRDIRCGYQLGLRVRLGPGTAPQNTELTLRHVQPSQEVYETTPR